MEITENPAAVRETLDLLQAEYHEVRDKFSVTKAIYCLTKGWYDQYDPLPLTDKEIVLFGVGFGLERVLIQSRMIHDEWELDGVVLHPDFLTIGGVLSDLKSTRAGTRPPTFETYGGMWLRQFMAYLKHRGGTEFDVLTVHLIQAEIKAWRFTFTPEEIDMNWAYILGRKMVYEQYEAQEVPPEAFQFNEKFECNSCRYALRCEAMMAGK